MYCHTKELSLNNSHNFSEIIQIHNDHHAMYDHVTKAHIDVRPQAVTVDQV